MPLPNHPSSSSISRVELTPEDLRLLAALKRKLDALFPSDQHDPLTPPSVGHPAAPRPSLDESLRSGLQRMLEEELSPFLREQVAAAIRNELGSSTSPLQPAQASPELLSVQEVARRCGVTVPTVREWIRSGLLPALSPGKGRIYRIRREDLATFLERRPTAGEGVAPKVDEQVERILRRVRVRAAGDKE